MTPEDLMKPRYKCVQDYPDALAPIGTVLNLQYDDRQKQWEYTYAEHDGMYSKSEDWFKEWPHLFKSLSWWEDREPEDMPEYVSTIGKNSFYKVYFIHQWVDWDGEFQMIDEDGEVVGANFRHFTPATQSSYDQYINSKQ